MHYIIRSGKGKNYIMYHIIEFRVKNEKSTNIPNHTL